MPNSKSAAKRLVTSKKCQMQNRVRKSRAKTAEKQFLGDLEQGDLEAAKTSLANCYSALDKAAKVGTIAQNKANRKKGRLSAKLAATAK